MKKYAEGSRFIDSLHEDDFSFRYKKRFFSESFTALQSEKNNDTLKSKELYQEISDDLEKNKKKGSDLYKAQQTGEGGSGDNNVGDKVQVNWDKG